MVWTHSSLPIDQLMVTWASSNLPFMDKLLLSLGIEDFL